ncbi:uncharacterized protein BDR25DRAFT_341627 [Lindgomyces ingoldianus]|uniref:Uncharacterized protein n=1 Tax=Lindgomyces ingoldianus TaxID=673940 RepID=A0ACB6R394_9PLEO|nr:uncharacterized protein BDR25DRAFT_341627 [Lindgomyces ingoldianus]KAF2472792.1 hypothetical protein BDR25DRAFT_341627 [Lindgomyces ingoldianus]
MPSYHRRRPVPIQIVPRQATTTSIISPKSTDSPSPTSSGGPESPDSPSPTASSFPPSNIVPPPATTEAAQVGSSATPPPPPPPPPPPSPTSTSQAPVSISSTEPGKVSSAPTPSSPVQASSSAAQSLPEVSSASRVTVISTSSPAVTTSAAPAITSTAASDFDFSSQNAEPVHLSTTSTSASVANSALPDNDNAPGKEPAQRLKNAPSGMSKGAEAALITVSVLGAIALFIALIFFIKRRRRRAQETHMRHASDAFNPSNTGSLHTPETSYTDSSHLTRSTTTTSPLFAADPDHRPETVSTDPSYSRFQTFPATTTGTTPGGIQPPMPSANPFADPPRNKAYDVLRGRPRSTTLTDRGSWVQNPFKDPVSDRFDPFGELQEKARRERLRYIEELRREQELLEKERMGLGLGGDARKGSGVTVEGLGVLDRSGDSRGFR